MGRTYNDRDEHFSVYLEELSRVKPFAPGEEGALLRSAASGDRQAVGRLVEGSLSKVGRWAAEYRGRGLPLADLFQEANTALMAAALAYDGGDWNRSLEQQVRSALDSALEQQKLQQEIEEDVAARVNVLQTVTERLTEELGREPTLEELALRMKMTQDEVRDIMKITLDAMTVSGEGAVWGEGGRR